MAVAELMRICWMMRTWWDQAWDLRKKHLLIQITPCLPEALEVAGRVV